MKKTIVALALAAFMSPVNAVPGGEGNNTGCNGVGNPNSPCEGNGGNSGGGSGSDTDYGYFKISKTTKVSTKSTNSLTNDISMGQHQSMDQWQSQGQSQGQIATGGLGGQGGQGGSSISNATGGRGGQGGEGGEGGMGGQGGKGGMAIGGDQQQKLVGGTQEINIGGSTYEAPKMPVNTAVASVGITTASCYVAGGAAGSGAAVSLSISGAIKDEDCEWRVKQAYRLTFGNQRTVDIATQLIQMDAEDDLAEALAKKAERKNVKTANSGVFGLTNY